MNFRILPGIAVSNAGLFFKPISIAILALNLSQTLAMNKEDMDLLHANHSLISGAIHGKIEQINNALQHGANINFTNSIGWTPLHIASYKSNVEVMKALLRHADININCTDSIGQTPLHIASSKDNLEIIKLLLNYGAHINQALPDTRYSTSCYSTSSGQTPLYLACEQGHVAIVKELLDNGANINSITTNHTTGQGTSPLGIARDSGHYDEIDKLICDEFNKRLYSSIVFGRLSKITNTDAAITALHAMQRK
jgi:ankyrin repeat protein